jgi:hypothetical protein
MPVPPGALMTPAFVTPPPIELLLMVIPVDVGGAVPFEAMTPVLVLVMLPDSVELTILMQVVLPLLVTEEGLFVCPLTVRHPAAIAGAPAPISSAMQELDANRASPRRRFAASFRARREVKGITRASINDGGDLSGPGQVVVDWSEVMVRGVKRLLKITHRCGTVTE